MSKTEQLLDFTGQEKPLVSVVVPVYNVKQYLERCIRSIVEQAYKNIEIILVDDGSSDGSSDVCDKYSAKDRRIKVIHKRNGGLSDARNAGLIQAKGDYIAFIDSDDYVSKEFIKSLYDLVLQNDAEISVCGYKRVNESDEYIEEDVNVSIDKVLNSKEALIDVLSPSSLCSIVTWNKLYKKTLFTDNDITFPVGKIHEDNFTTYKLMYEASKVAYTSAQLYYYTYREDSIMGRGFNIRSLDKIEAVEAAAQWLKDKKLNIQNEFEVYKLSVYIDVLNLITDAPSPIDLIQWNKMRKLILDEKNSFYSNDLISKKQKIAVLSAYLGRIPYGFSRKLYLKSHNFRKGRAA